MNALSFELFGEFEKTFETLLNDPAKDVRAVVLTSSSQHFTAGLDLTSAAQIGSISSGPQDS
jgi:enoyl-CoA hydratase/carnithine racemase